MKRLFIIHKKKGIDKDFKTWIDFAESLGAGLPSDDQQVIINKLFKDFKSKGIWGLEDLAYLPANNGSSILSTLNIYNPEAHRLTLHNTTFWTTNKGFKTDGLTGYFNTHWNPLNDGINFKGPNSSNTIYISKQQTVSATIGYFYGGYLNTAESGSMMGYRIGTTTMYWKNNSVTAQVEAGVIDYLGTHSVDRNDLDVLKQQLYSNGIAIDTNSGVVLEPITSFDTYLGGVNNNGVLTNENDVEWGFWSAGASQKDLQAIKNSLINQYMIDIAA